MVRNYLIGKLKDLFFWLSLVLLTFILVYHYYFSDKPFDISKRFVFVSCVTYLIFFVIRMILNWPTKEISVAEIIDAAEKKKSSANSDDDTIADDQSLLTSSIGYSQKTYVENYNYDFDDDDEDYNEFESFD